MNVVNLDIDLKIDFGFYLLAGVIPSIYTLKIISRVAHNPKGS